MWFHPIDSALHTRQRKRMVDDLAQKGIKDKRVLDAMLKVPRHLFISEEFLSHAYQDKAFPIGEGQTISQPFTVARQSELLLNSPNQSTTKSLSALKVLEVGTGSGYQSAVLMQLGLSVISVEWNTVLFNRTAAWLHKLGYTNCKLYNADGSLGFISNAPYNGIIVTAGAPVTPNALLTQLAPNGVMVIPVGSAKHQHMLKYAKDANGALLPVESFGGFAFVPLLGAQGWGGK